MADRSTTVQPEEANDFARRVSRLRERLAAHEMTASDIRREWDQIAADHTARLEALGGNPGFIRRLLEDLHFDADVLLHDLARFVGHSR